ncbi:MAG: D-2-hydroxyacid dehydrogenase [Bacteroidetes bacterium]|nr:D-2-hydroxyacid dehydrogenase [Bacteroidota bacterium]
MKIVVLDGYTLNPGDLNWDRLKAIGETEIYDRTETKDILSRASGAEILLTNKTPLSAEIINTLPGLRYIGVLATGYNVVETEAAAKRGIPVCNIPSYGTQSVAQMVFAHILNFCHHVQNHSDRVKEGKWAKNPDFCFWDYPLHELAGKKLGIIGFGRIGQKTADIGEAFGMQILGYDTFKSDQSNRPDFKWAELDELFSQSDFISLHCPLFEETKGFINTTSLRKMKKTAFLINTSRGPLIVEEDLAEALEQGIIAGAGLDVLGAEPPLEENPTPLLSENNCVITPHISWATKAARTRLMDMAVDNIITFQDGNIQNDVTRNKK